MRAVGRAGMRAVGRHELRHLAGSRLLWVGLALTGLLVYQERTGWWPVLAGDDLSVLRDAYLLGGVLVLLGAELAARDRRTGVADLVEAAPTPPERLLGWRLVAVAAVAAASFAALWLAAMAWLAVKGGRGLPDPRLLADGMLASVLAAGAGVAVGRLVKARLASLLAAVGWVGGSFALSDLDQVQRLRPSLQWLSPRFGRAYRSAIAGLLPDVAWPRLGWLAALVALVAGGLLLAAGGRARARRPGPLVALGLGAALAIASASVLVAAPDRLWFQGPGVGDWAAVDRTDQLPGVTVDANSLVIATAPGSPMSDNPAVYPDDGRATNCARAAHLSVCAAPAFGAMVDRLAAILEPVARRAAPLPGAVSMVRVVPPTGTQQHCADGRLLVDEDVARFEYVVPGAARSAFAGCVLERAADTEAGVAVAQWLTGPVSFQGLPDDPINAAGDAMRRRPEAEVQAALVRDWGRLMAGKLPLSALPGHGR